MIFMILYYRSCTTELYQYMIIDILLFLSS